MLERKRLIEELTTYFSVLQHYVRPSSQGGLVDINIISEDFVACILNALRGWKLKNVNIGRSNVPAIDLLDKSNRIGIQVTSKGNSKKINSTIKSLVESEFKENIDELFIFSLTPRQKKYCIYNECTNVHFSEKNIWDFDFVIREAKAQSTDIDILEKMHGVVIKNFAAWPKNVIQTAAAMTVSADRSDDSLIEETLKEVLERSFQSGELIKAQIILLIEKNETEKAKTLLDELADTRTSMAAQEFIDIANLYSLLKSDQADIYYTRATNLDPNSVKDANLYAIGLMHRGLLAEAEAVFKACLNKTTLSLREREAILGNLGFLCKNNGRFSNSISYFQEALLISEQTEHTIGRIKHLNGLGSCYLNLEELEESGRYFDQAKALLDDALNVSDDAGEKKELRSVKSNLLTNIAIRLKHLAEVTGDKNSFYLAEDTLKQAIDLADLMNDRKSLLRHYGNLANIYQALKKFGESRTYNKKSYELAIELEDKRSQIASILNAGLVDMDEGDLVSARANFERGIECDASVYPKLQANLLASIALACKRLKDNQSADEYFRAAEQLYIEFGLKESLRALHVRFEQCDAM